MRLLVERRNRGHELAERREAGVLYGSGLIAGAALIGVLGAVLTWAEVGLPEHGTSVAAAALAFGVLTATLVYMAQFRKTER